MRIIAGSAKGRRIAAPAGKDTRPTLDRVKESVFGVLQFRIAGKTVLDAFAGSGSMGLEALSRGAEECVFVDSQEECAKQIRENAQKLGFSDRSEIIRQDYEAAFNFFASNGRKFDIIFLDPPYRSGCLRKAVQMIFEKGLLAEGGVAIAEHETGLENSLNDTLYEVYDTRKYGGTSVSFIRR